MSTRKTIPETTPCKHCEQTIHYAGDGKGWRHAGEVMFCDQPLQPGRSANPGTWCPTCGEFCGETSDTSWGINTDCRKCGYHSYFSIGD